MSIIYFGTSSFAVPALIQLAPYIRLVVSQPDRPSGRGLKLQPSSVKQKALELGLPVLTPESCRDPEFLDVIRNLDPELIVTAAYGQIMPMSLLETPRHGAVNLHGSILPKYRGAAPIQRSIMAGDLVTGVTLMKMANGMDTGDMISTVTTPIDPNETYGVLHDRLAEIAGTLAHTWIDRLMQGHFDATPQDHALATMAAKITKEETVLSPAESGESAYNRLRGLSPRPGAYLLTNAGRLKIIEARLWNGNAQPGKIVSTDSGIAVSFLKDGLELIQVQPEGKRPMPGKDWLNGAHLKLGQNLL